ncbi:hypothetical protein KL930_005380 [Ogataea haglerorum]|nr:hypothetical protein KL951_005375 [Ogataea haglerorum]KAG7772427.1 hypothetical protein KL930_005380 [Ogataea haglerorum]KAG7773265.1 hypothetical protein KL922_005399 [Ogataea haglerorum]
MEKHIRTSINNFLKPRGVILNEDKTKVLDTMSEGFKGIPFLGVNIIKTHKNVLDKRPLLSEGLTHKDFLILVKPQQSKMNDLIKRIKSILKANPG